MLLYHTNVINCKTCSPHTFVSISQCLITVPQGSGMKLGHNGIYYAEDKIHHIAMNLTQDGWKHMEGSSKVKETAVSREVSHLVL